MNKIDFIFESYLDDARDKLAEQNKFRRANFTQWMWIVEYLQELNRSDNKKDYLLQKIRELEENKNKSEKDIILLNISRRIKIEIEEI